MTPAKIQENFLNHLKIIFNKGNHKNKYILLFEIFPTIDKSIKILYVFNKINN
jgi:hypothetical protein